MKHSIKFTLCALVILNVHIGFVLGAQEAPPQSHIERNDEPGLEPIDPDSSDFPIIASLIKNEYEGFIDDPSFRGDWQLDAAFFAPECKPQNESDCNESSVVYINSANQTYFYPAIYKDERDPERDPEHNPPYLVVRIDPAADNNWIKEPDGSPQTVALMEVEVNVNGFIGKLSESITVSKTRMSHLESSPYGLDGYFTEKALEIHRTDLANIPTDRGGTFEENRRYEKFNNHFGEDNLKTHFMLYDKGPYEISTTLDSPCLIDKYSDHLMFCAVYLGSDPFLYPKGRDFIIYRFERLML